MFILNVPQSPEDDMATIEVQQDNEDLVKRLTEVQLEKWLLEEKVISFLLNSRV